MNIYILNLYFFLAQFPSFFKLGSSNFGAHIFLLPILFFNKRVIKVSSLIYPIMLISIIWGFLNFQGNINILEIILRIVSVQVALVGLIYPLEIAKKFNSKKEFFTFFVEKLLYLNIPTISFLYLELIYKLTKSNQLYNLLFILKDFFIKGRSTHTIGTISGFFPEHGMFVTYLLFLSGLSCIYIFFENTKRISFSKIMAFSWIFFLFFHQSGLYLFSIFLIFLLISVLSIVHILIKRKVLKKLITKIIPFFIIFFVTCYYWLFYTQKFLFERFEILFSLINEYGLKTDRTIYFKSLPFIIFSKLNIKELFFGSGVSQYTQLVISKIKYLPQLLTNDLYFISNVNRFPLNSLFVCQFIEYGLLGSIFIIFILTKFQLIKPISFTLFYANIFKNKPIFILSSLLFLGTFLSGFGAIPLMYPYTYLSIPMIILISE